MLEQETWTKWHRESLHLPSRSLHKSLINPLIDLGAFSACLYIHTYWCCVDLRRMLGNAACVARGQFSPFICSSLSECHTSH